MDTNCQLIILSFDNRITFDKPLKQISKGRKVCTMIASRTVMNNQYLFQTLWCQKKLGRIYILLSFFFKPSGELFSVFH